MMARVAGSTVLLVEGVPGIGKSTLLDLMLRRYVATEEPGRLRTVVSLAQTYTYGPLAVREDEGTLTVADNLAHLDAILSALEWLVQHANGQSRVKTFILIDTLHLTHCVRPGVLDWPTVTPLDARLAAIGGKLVLLDAEEETIRARTVAARAQTEFIQSYARGRFGQNEPELVQHFTRERDRFRTMFAASAMCKLRLSAEQPVDTNTDREARFWLDS